MTTSKTTEKKPSTTTRKPKASNKETVKPTPESKATNIQPTVNNDQKDGTNPNPEANNDQKDGTNPNPEANNDQNGGTNPNPEADKKLKPELNKLLFKRDKGTLTFLVALSEKDTHEASSELDESTYDMERLEIVITKAVEAINQNAHHADLVGEMEKLMTDITYDIENGEFKKHNEKGEHNDE